MREITGRVVEVLPGEKDGTYKDKNGKGSCFVLVEEIQHYTQDGEEKTKVVLVPFNFWAWRADKVLEQVLTGKTVRIQFELHGGAPNYKTLAKLQGRAITVLEDGPVTQKASSPAPAPNDLPF